MKSHEFTDDGNGSEGKTTIRRRHKLVQVYNLLDDSNREYHGGYPEPLKSSLYSKGRLVMQESMKYTVSLKDQLAGKNG